MQGRAKIWFGVALGAVFATPVLGQSANEIEQTADKNPNRIDITGPVSAPRCTTARPQGFFHSGLRPHFKKGLAVVHLGAETGKPFRVHSLAKDRKHRIWRGDMILWSGGSGGVGRVC